MLRFMCQIFSCEQWHIKHVNRMLLSLDMLRGFILIFCNGVNTNFLLALSRVLGKYIGQIFFLIYNFFECIMYICNVFWSYPLPIISFADKFLHHLVQAQVSLKERTIFDKMFLLSVICIQVWFIFLTDDWLRRAQFIVSSAPCGLLIWVS